VTLPLLEVFLKDVSFAWRHDAISVELALSDAVSVTARVRIPELGIQHDIAVTNGRGKALIHALPALWSPGSPRLYDVTVECASDQVTERMGFRTIAVDGERILLNGQPIRLRGACVHEDDMDLGKTTNEADLRRNRPDRGEDPRRNGTYPPRLLPLLTSTAYGQPQSALGPVPKPFLVGPNSCQPRCLGCRQGFTRRAWECVARSVARIVGCAPPRLTTRPCPLGSSVATIVGCRPLQPHTKSGCAAPVRGGSGHHPSAQKCSNTLCSYK
jgi:hypothetical protein